MYMSKYCLKHKFSLLLKNCMTDPRLVHSAGVREQLTVSQATATAHVPKEETTVSKQMPDI